MTIEELRKYKQELLVRRSSETRYFICDNYEEIFYGKNKINGSIYTKSEIINATDTDALVKKCEELLARYTKILVERLDVDVKMVSLCAKPSLILKDSFLSNLETIRDIVNNGEDYNAIIPYILKDYVSLTFSLNPDSTEIEDNFTLRQGSYEHQKKRLLCLCSNEFELKQKYGIVIDRYLGSIIDDIISESELDQASGIVKYNDFVKIISSLGYNVQFSNNNSIKTFNSYIKKIISGDASRGLNIVANLKQPKVRKKIVEH